MFPSRSDSLRCFPIPRQNRSGLRATTLVRLRDQKGAASELTCLWRYGDFGQLVEKTPKRRPVRAVRSTPISRRLDELSTHHGSPCGRRPGSTRQKAIVGLAKTRKAWPPFGERELGNSFLW